MANETTKPTDLRLQTDNSYTIKFPADLMLDSPHRGSVVIYFTVLFSICETHHHCSLTDKELANMCKVSVRTIHRFNAALVGSGHIARVTENQPVIVPGDGGKQKVRWVKMRQIHITKKGVAAMKGGGRVQHTASGEDEARLHDTH